MAEHLPPSSAPPDRTALDAVRAQVAAGRPRATGSAEPAHRTGPDVPVFGRPTRPSPAEHHAGPAAPTEAPRTPSAARASAPRGDRRGSGRGGPRAAERGPTPPRPESAPPAAPAPAETPTVAPVSVEHVDAREEASKKAMDKAKVAWEKLQELKADFEQARSRFERMNRTGVGSGGVRLGGAAATSTQEYRDAQEEFNDAEAKYADQKEIWYPTALDEAEFAFAGAGELKSRLAIRREVEGEREPEDEAEMPEDVPELTEDLAEPPPRFEVSGRTIEQGERILRTLWLMPKIIVGSLLTVSGYKAAKVAIDTVHDGILEKRAPKFVARLAQELHEAYSRGAAAVEPPAPSAADAHETPGATVQEKGQELLKAIEKLIVDGRITPEEGTGLAQKIDQAFVRHSEQTEQASKAFGQEVARLTKDAYDRSSEKRIDMRLAQVRREVPNFLFMVSGLSFALRSGVRLATAVRAQYEKVQDEYEARLEQNPPDDLISWGDRQKEIWSRVVETSGQEMSASVGQAGEHLWSLFSGEAQARDEYLKREMSFSKVAGVGLVAGGFAYKSVTEIMHHESPDFGAQAFAKSFSEKGLLGTWGENFLRPIAPVLAALHRSEADAAHSATPAEAVPAEHHVLTGAEVEKAYLDAHPQWARLENEYQGKIDVQGHADGHVSVEFTLGGAKDLKYSEHAIDKAVTMSANLPTGNTLDTIHGAHLQNVEGNINALLRHERLLWKDVDGSPHFVEPSTLKGIVHPEGNSLVIDDLEKFDHAVNDEFLPHAMGKDVGRLSGAVASLGDQSETRLQHDLDIKTGVPGAITVKFDHGMIHGAQVTEFKWLAKDSDIEHHLGDAKIIFDDAEIVNAHTGDFHVGNQEFHVEHGQLSSIATNIGGHDHIYDLSAAGHHPIDMHSAHSGTDIKEAMATAKHAAETTEAASRAVSAAHASAGHEAVAHLEAVHGLEAPRITHYADVGALHAALSGRGLVNEHGDIQFGDTSFKSRWLEEVKDMEVGEFVKSPPQPFSWFGISGQAEAYRDLARVIGAYRDAAEDKLPLLDYLGKRAPELDRWLTKV